MATDSANAEWLTFLFTDIEGSTDLVGRSPNRYRGLRDRQEKIIRSAASRAGGTFESSAGDGLFLTFPSPAAGIKAAVASQLRLWRAWPDGTVKVRMGLHIGRVHGRPGNWTGRAINLAARIANAANGGQILVSEAIEALVRDDLPGRAVLRAVGLHALKDFGHTMLYRVDPSPDHINDRPLRAPKIPDLPIAPWDLIDRVEDVDAVVRLLREHRHVVISGAPGVGKTRVALAVAERIRDHSQDAIPGGAVWVDLTDVRDLAGLTAQLVRALNLPGDRFDLHRIAGELAGRRALLVLDNFEQIEMDAARELLARFDGVNGLRLLITSRDRGSAPHRVHELRPLGLGQTEPGQSDAVAWFIARARVADDGFDPGPEELRLIERICARLDGLPLAISLVAARIDLGLDRLLTRVDAGHLRRFVSSGQVGGERPGTVRSAIELSFDRLGPNERDLFLVLAGLAGFSHDAVDFIANERGWVAPGDEPYDFTLVLRSLVEPLDRPGRERRYRMLRTIADFGLDRAAEEPGRVSKDERLRAEYLLAFATEADRELGGQTSRTWLDRFEDEQLNILHAIEWALGAREAELAIELAVKTSWFWILHSHLRTGVSTLERALEATAAASPTAPAAHARLANLVRVMGRIDDAERHYRDALRLPQANAFTRAYAENGLGRVAASRGWVDAARRHYLRALRIRRRSGLLAGVAVTLDNLGDLALEAETPDIEAARNLYRDAADIRLALPNGDLPGLAVSAFKRSLLAEAQGDRTGAQSHLADALRRFHEIGYRQWLVDCLDRAASLSSDAERGATLIGAAAKLQEDLGAGRGPVEDGRHAAMVRRIAGGLSPAAFAQAQQAGRAMSTDGAVAFALLAPVDSLPSDG